MRIALIGASGHIGSKILHEALHRGHQVTAIVRDPTRLPAAERHLIVRAGDATDPQQLAALVAGHEALVSAFGLGMDVPVAALSQLSTVAATLLAVARQTGIGRVLNVGGAGSLEVAPGVALVDTPQFPEAWKGTARAHRDALAVFRAENDLDWTYFSPALVIGPGTRTGTFRLGHDSPVFDAAGASTISYDDYAVAVLNELEKPQFIRQRFTIGY